MKLPVWKILLLYPFSMIYAFVVFFRNKLFYLDLIKSKEYNFPVISVGNISVGGTGKTPHTEYLLSLLRTSGLRVAMLSRGYKRKTKGFILADENATAQTIGDEPFQVYRKFNDVLVAVDKNRRRAIETLRQLDSPPQVVVLDDAFQHRFVTPGISILLVDYNRLIYKDYFLPLGHLREACRERSRADVIVITKCPKELTPIETRIIEKNLTLMPTQTLYFSRFVYGEIYPMFELQTDPFTKSLLKEKKASVLIVTGIVSAEDFYAHVQQTIGDYEALKYPDHHSFSLKDWSVIRSRFEDLEGAEKVLLVSEKDAARLVCDPNLPDELKSSIYALPIKVTFLSKKEQLFNEQIYDYVRKNKRNGRFS